MLIFDYNKYGGSDLNGKIIVKSSEMPVPSAEYNGEIYIYAGETSETYTDGPFRPFACFSLFQFFSIDYMSSLCI